MALGVTLQGYGLSYDEAVFIFYNELLNRLVARLLVPFTSVRFFEKSTALHALLRGLGDLVLILLKLNLTLKDKGCFGRYALYVSKKYIVMTSFVALIKLGLSSKMFVGISIKRSFLSKIIWLSVNILLECVTQLKKFFVDYFWATYAEFAA